MKRDPLIDGVIDWATFMLALLCQLPTVVVGVTRRAWAFLSEPDQYHVGQRLRLGDCQICKGVGRVRRQVLLSNPRQLVDAGVSKCPMCGGTGSKEQTGEPW